MKGSSSNIVSVDVHLNFKRVNRVDTRNKSKTNDLLFVNCKYNLMQGRSEIRSKKLKKARSRYISTGLLWWQMPCCHAFPRLCHVHSDPQINPARRCLIHQGRSIAPRQYSKCACKSALISCGRGRGGTASATTINTANPPRALGCGY